MKKQDTAGQKHVHESTGIIGVCNLLCFSSLFFFFTACFSKQSICESIPTELKQHKKVAGGRGSRFSEMNQAGHFFLSKFIHNIH